MLVRLFALCFLFVVAASAASIQIVVRNDAGRIVQNARITLNPPSDSGNQMLKSIRDWRAAQFDNADPPQLLFPDTAAGHAAFWGTVLVPSLKVKILLFPYPGLMTRKRARDTARDDTQTELNSAFQ